MFCPNCGAQNADGAGFCGQCGHALSSQSTPSVPPVGANSGMQNSYSQQQSFGTSPFGGQPSYGGGSFGQQPFGGAPQPYAPASPIVSALKNLGSSPLFLVAVICYTVSAFLSLVNSFAPSNYLLGTLFDMADSIGLPGGGLNNILSAFGSFYIVMAIIAMIPVILMTVGMWLTFASCADKRSPSIKTGGLTIIRVLNIISLVSICISAGVLAIVFLLGMIGALTNDGGSLFGVLFGVFLLCAAVFACIILYYAKLSKMLRDMINTANCGTVTGLASKYVAVMSIIIGSCSFLASFPTFMISGFFGGMSSMTSAAATICFGVFIFIYNSTVSRFRTSYSDISVPTPNPYGGFGNM